VRSVGCARVSSNDGFGARRRHAGEIAGAPQQSRRGAPQLGWLLRGSARRLRWADAKDLTPTNTPRNLDPTGYFAGGQVGCNWQWQPQWVFGVEADLAGANISETKSFTGGGQPTIEEKIDRLATIRARAGFVSGQNLLYVTGGWGWADTSRHVRLAGLGGNPFQTQSESFDGWVLGAGLEHMIAQNWTVKLEYLYYDLGSGTYAFTIGTGPNKVDLSLHTIKFGVNYKW
jgi:outer membrane immunogenic protein